MQIELVHTLVESEKSTLSEQDKLFILRQYRLNLERELTQAAALIRKIDGRTPSESAAAGGAAPEAKKA
jgi:hypothetical protein